MKKIFLVRHAESSISSLSISDFDRPLSKNGILESNLISSKLKENKISIDCFISSSAKRAKSTAKIFAENFNYNTKDIIINSYIYNSSAYDLINIIYNIPNHFNEVLIFGHNPSLHDVAQRLTNKVIHKFPTCSVCCIEFKIDNWTQVRFGKKNFLIYPSQFKV